jgi:MarR family transcriptional regulator, organic hydroperoxide resistance regulator
MLLGVDAAEELRYLVLAAQRDGNRRLTALLRPLGVTPAQAEALRVVADAPSPPTVRDVGSRLVCEPGHPSRLVASLVDLGLLDRTPDPDDGRASRLELTARGRRTADALRDAERRFHAELAAAVGSARDAEAAMRVLRGVAGDGASAAALRRRLA